MVCTFCGLVILPDNVCPQQPRLFLVAFYEVPDVHFYICNSCLEVLKVRTRFDKGTIVRRTLHVDHYQTTEEFLIIRNFLAKSNK